MSIRDTKGLEEKNRAWQDFVNGNEASFEAVFKAYYKSMHGYGVKLCGKPELVKDCIQTLFQDIWERRKQLTHIESPNVYLFVSLRRKILKEVKESRKTSGDLEEIDEDVFLHFGKEDFIIKNEVKFQKKKELKEALNQLSGRQREVVYLHFYNGVSYGEIENILSINRQSVRNYIYRAMETLRTLLDSEMIKLVGTTLFITIPF